MHLLVILGISLLVFGPKKLPELGKGLGDGIRGFKKAIGGEEAEASISSAGTVALETQAATKAERGQI